MANPGQWVILTLVFLFILIGSQLIPVIGPIGLTLVLPALFGGFLLAAEACFDNRPIGVGFLFTGLTEETKRNPLLTLGVIALGLSILISIITAGVLAATDGTEVLKAMSSKSPDPEMMAKIGSAMTKLMLIGALFSAFFTMFMVYAVPLVMFTGMQPVEAMGQSFKASVINVVPLMIFGIIYSALLMVALIPFGAGLLVLLPVSVIAMYVSYRQIFADIGGNKNSTSAQMRA